MPKSKTERLNQKQEDFCYEYVKLGVGKTAAINVGYAERSAEMMASRMLRLDKIQKKIKEIRAKAIERAERHIDLTIEEVIGNARKVIEVCSQTVIDKDGIKSMVDPKSANTANEQLAKMVGAYREDNAQKRPDKFIVQWGGEEKSDDD